MQNRNSAEFEAKYKEYPEDIIDRCADKVQFMAEVAQQVPLGEELTFSPRATNALYWILRGTAEEMRDSLEELQRQRKAEFPRAATDIKKRA